MNVLTDTRQAVVDDLVAAGITATTWVPSNLNTPCALVGSAPEYVTKPEGENPFKAAFSINLQVLLLAGSDMNETALEDTDDLIVDALDALDDWDVTEVTAPFQFRTEDGFVYTAAMLTVTTNSNIERMV